MTNALREQLQGIYDQHGKLTPALVLEQARDVEHPLHARFEWDDTVAAERWRHEQAHELIRSVKVAYRNAEGVLSEVRSFHAFKEPNGAGHVYEPVEKIASDEMMSKILLADMKREWQSLKRRYEQYEEFHRLVRRDLDAAA